MNFYPDEQVVALADEYQLKVWMEYLPAPKNAHERMMRACMTHRQIELELKGKPINQLQIDKLK